MKLLALGALIMFGLIIAPGLTVVVALIALWRCLK
jgi:hypothetical protein